MFIPLRLNISHQTKRAVRYDVIDWPREEVPWFLAMYISRKWLKETNRRPPQSIKVIIELPEPRRGSTLQGRSSEGG